MIHHPVKNCTDHKHEHAGQACQELQKKTSYPCSYFLNRDWFDRSIDMWAVPELQQPRMRWRSSSPPSPCCTRSLRIGSRPEILTWLRGKCVEVKLQAVILKYDTLGRRSNSRDVISQRVGFYVPPWPKLAIISSDFYSSRLFNAGADELRVFTQSRSVSLHSFVHRCGISKHFLEGFSLRRRRKYRITPTTAVTSCKKERRQQ